jgi:hypothetical protein
VKTSFVTSVTLAGCGPRRVWIGLDPAARKTLAPSRHRADKFTRMRKVALACWLALAACGGSSGDKPAPTAQARDEAPLTPPPAPTGAAAQVAPLLAPTATIDPNPLHLPAAHLTLDPGKRVFAPSDQMLSSAKLGSTLVLYATTAIGLDGDDVIVEGRGGPSFKVHAAYVIPVPDEPRLRQGDAVITEHAGVLHHAVVTKLQKDKTLVRFTDLDARAPESGLKNARFIKQLEGLQPGNFAAWRDGEVWRHVLLVSSFNEGGTKHWLALGFGGAALKVDESSLRAMPIKYNPKVGTAVWAENVGTLRRAVITAADELGVFTVKFDRAGRPATTGWGLIMQPVE